MLYQNIKHKAGEGKYAQRNGLYVKCLTILKLSRMMEDFFEMEHQKLVPVLVVPAVPRLNILQKKKEKKNIGGRGVVDTVINTV